MLKMDAKGFNEVRQWVYRNARHLELMIWKYEFENGSKEAVLDALSFYQNADGGFGNALEPDNWNPNSTPYSTANAISRLKTIGYADVQHPIVSGILRFLNSGAYFTENGWEWSIPTNNDYPHAPWWNFEQADSTTEFGLSCDIAGFVLSVCQKDSELYNKAVTVIQNIVNRLRNSIECDTAGGNVHRVCDLVETLQKYDMLDKFDAAFLPEASKKMVAQAIGMDSEKWVEVGSSPLEYITNPDSVFYNDYKDAVQHELDCLIETRPKQSVWGIGWSWYDNQEKYANAFSISENWWKSDIALSNIRILKHFNRLDLHEPSHT